MNLILSLAAWAVQGSYVAAGTSVRMRERDSQESAEVRRLVAARQQRVDRSYAGALIAAFWASFPWLDAVNLHLMVNVRGGIDVQPVTPAMSAGSQLPAGIRTPQGTFNAAAAVGAITEWWMEQDLYQALSEDGDTSDLSIALRRGDVANLLASDEVDGLAVFDAIEKAGRIDGAGSEPTYALAQEVGHA